MGLLTVVVHIVVAEDHVNVVAVLVLDVQVRQGGAVGDELWRLVQVDAFYPCLSPTCALMPSAEIVYRPSSPGPGAWQSRVMAAAFATVATKSNENLILTYTDLTWWRIDPREAGQNRDSNSPSPPSWAPVLFL